MEPAPEVSAEDLHRQLGFSAVWKRGYVGAGITVGVLDTSVGSTPELDGALVDTQDCVNAGDAEQSSTSTHGTHIALTIHRIAPEAKIVSLQVFPDKTLGFQHNAVVRRAVTRALDICTDSYPRMRVANLSLAIPRGRLMRCTPKTPCTVCQAVDRAYKAGVVVVAAGGNTGPEPDTIECPGQAPGAITVGATLSATANEYYRKHGDPDGRYGTSFSCGYISGGIALLLSACPEATPEEMRGVLKSTAEPIAGEPQSHQGAGKAHLERALVALIGPSPEAFATAQRQLYWVAGNRDAQRDSNDFVVRPLRLALSYVD